MSVKAEDELTGLAQAMERVLYPPQPNEWGKMASHIKRLVNRYGSMDPDDPALRRVYVRFARHLRVAVSATIDLKFLSLCLRAMLNIGRDGWLAAVDFVASSGVGHNELATLLRGLRPVEQLFLANQWLQQKQATDSSLRRMLLDIAATGGDHDPTTLLLFFSRLGQERVQVFYPLKELLLAAKFGKWLKEQVPLDHSANTELALARALYVLDDPGLTQSFLLARLDGSRNPGEYVWQLAIEKGGRGNDVLAKAVCRYLSKGELHVRQRAVDVLACLDWPKSGLVLARMFIKTPSMRKSLASRSLVLGERDFTFFIQSIGPDEQRHLYRYLFSLLCSLAPDFVLHCLEGGHAQPLDQAEVRTLSKVLMRIAEEQDTLLVGNAGRDGRAVLAWTETVPESPARGHSFFRRILGRDHGDASAAFNGNGPLRDLKITGSSLQGLVLCGRRMEQCVLQVCSFTNVVFREMRVTATDFGGSRMYSVTFDGCHFEYVTLREVAFHECRFVNCRFVRCDFSSAGVTGSMVQACAFEECLMDCMAWEHGRASQVVLSNVVLHGAVVRNMHLEGCRFAGTALSFGIWRNVELLGCDFDFCDMTGLQCRDSIFRGGRVQGNRGGARLFACESGLPDFLDFTASTLRERAAALGEAGVPLATGGVGRAGTVGGGGVSSFSIAPEILEFTASDKGFSLGRSLVHLWGRHWSFARNEAAMLHYNGKRLAFMESRADERKRIFLRLFPLLLSTDVGHEALGLDAGASCPAISAYCPSHEELELCREQFGRLPEGLYGTSSGQIAAVYSIGSLGSLAQTQDSDFDCWVCLEDSVRLSPEDKQKLEAKLHALECYAWDVFGLETHFFLMSLDDVRNNRFGFSDKESSGSAQALLLKDEFYRTALCLAGKSLAWWLMPPSALAGEYAERVKDALDYPMNGWPRVADFGSLEHIPREEFFGACLWQMVKAVKSPFKTVMKFGLLERYAQRLDKKAPLLCERIRLAVLHGRAATMFRDPYAALYAEVVAFYRSLGQADAERLVAEAFMQRISAGGISQVFGYAVSDMEELVVRDVFKPRGVEPGDQDGSAKWGFRKKKRVGESVNRFILDTYRRIHSEGVSGQGRDVRITEEDLTRLGRQILAVYAPKKEKIGLVSFLGGDNSPMSELALEGIKAPGKMPVWIAKGRGRETRSGFFEELIKGRNVYAVLAWLACNGIYTPGMILRMENTAPLAMDDIVSILTDLSGFIPFSSMIASDLDVFLEEERIARVFCIVNLTVSREVREVVEVGLIYKTTWGELFTRRVTGADAAAIARPEKFFKDHLPLPCSTCTEYKCFMPRRSQCPRISLF